MFIRPPFTAGPTITFKKAKMQSKDVNDQTIPLNSLAASISDQRASVVITSNTTLVGNRDIFNPVSADTSNITLTLPAVSSHNSQPIRIYNRSTILPNVAGTAGTVIINTVGSDTIINPFNSNASGTSLRMVIPGECFDIYPVAAGVWCVAVLYDGAANFPNFHANRAADLNNAGTYSVIDWTVKSSSIPGFEAWDDGGYFDLLNDRYTPRLGVRADYEFKMQSNWSAGTSADLNTYLVRNEDSPQAQAQMTTSGSFGAHRTMECELNGTTDYVTARAGSFGATRTLVGSTGNRYLFFEGKMLRRKQ